MDAELREAERAGDEARIRLLKLRQGLPCPRCLNPFTQTWAWDLSYGRVRLTTTENPMEHRCYVGLPLLKTLKVGTRIYHVTQRWGHGGPVSARINGKLKLWTRKPWKFRVGLRIDWYTFDSIDNNNAHYKVYVLTPEETVHRPSAFQAISRMVDQAIVCHNTLETSGEGS